MKRSAIIVLMSILAMPVYIQASDLGNVYISHLEGDVQINTEETGEWIPATLNMPLKESDRIWVPQGGRAEIRMAGNSAARLNELTSADLEAPGSSYGFRINKGSAYFNYNGSSILNITTPTNRLWTSERSKFRVNVNESGFAETSVFRGRVNTEYNGVRITIPEGRYLPYTGQFTSDLRTLASADDWDRWNAQRDSIDTGKYASSNHLPEELSTYSRDFDTHGKWVYVRDYGYCWQPVTVVNVGWAPYKSGRWVWIRGDYVWVSYEPWGWAPYHYGRWTHVVSFGWVWVPPARGAVYWGPGFVAWVHTPTHVAWVPLAPREIYYGRGYYEPHSVNITNVTIKKTIINKTVYRNVDSRYAVTAVSRDSFATGRPVAVKSSENIFKYKDASFGRPEVKFERQKSVNITNNKTVIINNSHLQNSVKAPAPKINKSNVQLNSAPATNQREIQPMQREMKQQPVQQSATKLQNQVQIKREAEPKKDLQHQGAPRMQSMAQQQQSIQTEKPQPSVENKRQAEREFQPRFTEQQQKPAERQQISVRPQQQFNQQRPVQQQKDMQPERKIEQQNTYQPNRSFSAPAPAARQQQHAEIKRNAPKQQQDQKPQQIERQNRNVQMKSAPQNKEGFAAPKTNNSKSFNMPAKAEKQNQIYRGEGKKERM
ncbi:MAG: FecR domain-containing protein [Nitrospirae bacterium]|nr:FecR domain-containing protein [Nitrospirota bacterium]